MRDKKYNKVAILTSFKLLFYINCIYQFII